MRFGVEDVHSNPLFHKLCDFNLHIGEAQFSHLNERDNTSKYVGIAIKVKWGHVHGSPL